MGIIQDIIDVIAWGMGWAVKGMILIILGPWILFNLIMNNTPVVGKAWEKLWNKIRGKVLTYFLGWGSVKRLRELFHAFDPFKWGKPITEGDQIAISNYMQQHSERYNQGSGQSLIVSYFKLKDGFKRRRRGWLAEFMADAYAENDWEAFEFLVKARLALFYRLWWDTKRSLARSPGSADTWQDKTAAFLVWVPLFFYSFTVLLGGVVQYGVWGVLDPTFMWFWFVLYLAWTKWYGQYGWYVPFFGSNSIGSGISFVGLMVMTVAVGYRVFQVMTGIGGAQLPFTLITIPGWFPVIGWIAGFFGLAPILWPNPLYFGMGHLVSALALPTLLLFWGVAGMINLYYGEYVEDQQISARARHVIQEASSRI